MTPGQRFRRLMERERLLVLPGVYDCLGARLAAEAGFEAVFTSGFGLSAALLGKPDFGLLTASQVLESVARLAESTPLPLVADLDTGYGSALNVYYVVREAVRAGAAGVILEDQQWPKKCGHFQGKRVIPKAEHMEKIRAAAEARGDSGLVIIGRTDARAVHGLEDALERGRAYHEAGADVVFIEAPESVAELREIPVRLAGIPTFANMIEGGRTPLMEASELEAMGFRIVVFPLSGLFAAVSATRAIFGHLRRWGSTRGAEPPVGFHEFQDFIGLEAYRELERRFSVPPAES
jgi:methylisocitrate lyase